MRSGEADQLKWTDAFLGMAVGPFTATSILGSGEPLRVLGMFATMASLSFLASIVIYLTHKGLKSTAELKAPKDL